MAIKFLSDILFMRLPTPEEWEALMQVARRSDKIVHWRDIASWGGGTDPSTSAMLFGCFDPNARLRSGNRELRTDMIGLRPVVESPIAADVNLPRPVKGSGLA